MSSRWAHITIGSIALQDLSGRWCRAEFLDAEALKGTVVASSVVALDATVHTQWTERGAAGVRFGVQVAQLHVSLLDAIVAALESAVKNGESIPVTGSDAEGIDDVAVRATVEYQNGKPYTRGQFSGHYVRDITFRFISIGAAG